MDRGLNEEEAVATLVRGFFYVNIEGLLWKKNALHNKLHYLYNHSAF